MNQERETSRMIKKKTKTNNNDTNKTLGVLYTPYHTSKEKHTPTPTH